MSREIETLTKDEILNLDIIRELYETTADNEKEAFTNELLDVAKSYKLVGYVKKNLNKIKYQVDNIGITYDEHGIPENTVDNIVTIIENDPNIKNTYMFNSLSYKPIKINSDGSQSIWNDMDDSNLIHYIENTYGIYNSQKYYTAFNVACSRRQTNPIKELIEYKEWDGIPRIDKFLTDILKCDKSNYSREVSRMIFYGGINRLYNPGCKFDYMPILIAGQGKGKSTIVRWLALNDKYYADLSTIEGKDALENIQGMWICELSELVAMVRSREVEAMKSFITRNIDHFRESYGRRTNDYPRTCIFIGTTNDTEFLYDKTGNRRYLPIEMHTKIGEISKKEDYIRGYILECWREALYLLKKDEAYLTIPSEYYNEVLDAQNNAVEDDPQVGLLLDYLDTKQVGDKVCSLEIFTKCFNGIKKNFNRLTAKEISRMLENLPNWQRNGNNTYRFPEYGTQRYWEKIEIDDTKKENKKWDDLD